MMGESRVKTTQDRFIDAYVHLSKERGQKKITVAALCREAGISRYTFYAHYLDLEDFLQKADQQIIEKLLAAIDTYKFDMDTSRFDDLFFPYILEQADIIFAVLEREGGPGLQMIMDLFEQKILPVWKKESTLSPEQLELLFTYAIHGTFEYARRWWKSGFQIDMESAATIFGNVLKYGVYHYIYTI